MKKVVKLKLLVDEVQREMLHDDLALCNEMANVVARCALSENEFSNYRLRRLTHGDGTLYDHLRSSGLASQASQHVIKKVSDAYKTRASRARNGGYGKIGSERHRKIMSKPVTFRPLSAHPYDRRNMSWDVDRRLVALTTRTGRRVNDIRYTGRDVDLVTIATCPKGEADLLCDDQGRWFLVVTVDIEEPLVHAPEGFFGVDMGVVVIAAVADDRGHEIADWSGGAVTRRRKKNFEIRRQLQRKGTRSAKRRLKARKRKETRFVTDVNHCISKNIIAKAQRTGHGVALENLSNIRDRVRLRQPQRAMVHLWVFAQLGQMIMYKGCEAGVMVVQVDPRYTSQTCSRCGHRDKRSRRDQATFVCCSCGVSLNADMNAAVNIARRGVDSQGAVNHP